MLREMLPSMYSLTILEGASGVQARPFGPTGPLASWGVSRASFSGASSSEGSAGGMGPEVGDVPGLSHLARGAVEALHVLGRHGAAVDGLYGGPVGGGHVPVGNLDDDGGGREEVGDAQAVVPECFDLALERRGIVA